ncbi:cysteine desulfurase [Candidatus Saccharibacteria bacterium]|nr:cysteine desulfurase [Candidatus Saccharibacteria bacterium]
MSQESIYLDYAAATPLDSTVLEAMILYFSDVFYNPSAPYEGGRLARDALESARSEVAQVLGAKSTNVIFTAGATESIQIALVGLLKSGGYAVIGATEHAAVRGCVRDFPSRIALADNRGYITPESVRKVIQDDTVVVSIALADSEFGTVQPIADIAHMINLVRHDRREKGNKTPLYLHSDGSQATGSLELKTSRLGVDLLSLNASKCYGPKQVGVLWVRNGIVLEPLVSGGGQERGLRSGTENVAGAVGCAKAISMAQTMRYDENRRLQELRTYLLQQLEQIDGLVVDGHPKKHLPGHLHVHISGLDSERVIYRLDIDGVYIATGAACAANKGKRNPALEAVGMTPAEADGSLRISLGRSTTKQQLEIAARAIKRAIDLERGL